MSDLTINGVASNSIKLGAQLNVSPDGNALLISAYKYGTGGAVFLLPLTAWNGTSCTFPSDGSTSGSCPGLILTDPSTSVTGLGRYGLTSGSINGSSQFWVAAGHNSGVTSWTLDSNALGSTPSAISVTSDAPVSLIGGNFDCTQDATDLPEMLAIGFSGGTMNMYKYASTNSWSIWAAGVKPDKTGSVSTLGHIQQQEGTCEHPLMGIPSAKHAYEVTMTSSTSIKGTVNESPIDGFGTAFAVLDLNGDGTDELAVSATSDSGTSYIYILERDYTQKIILNDGTTKSQLGQAMAAIPNVCPDFSKLLTLPGLLVTAPSAADGKLKLLCFSSLYDRDGDGKAVAEDCDDADKDVYNGQTEICNGKDDDCDGLVDSEDSSVTGGITFYRDNDGDSYGATSSGTLTACTQPTGYSINNTDCDDSNAAIHLDADEVCDDKDNDCNDKIDEGLDTTNYYPDADGDGYGNESGPLESCKTEPPTGYIPAPLPSCVVVPPTCYDCNDKDASIYPGATEVCDGIDGDCDTIQDTNETGLTDNADMDGDGAPDCADPDIDGDGYEAVDDCDDRDSSIRPGAKESCNLIDDDCDGIVDEGFDQDGDGVTSCRGDCNDSNNQVHPNQADGPACDGIDNDCDTLTDEDSDLDGDDYFTCEGTDDIPENTDCDDHVPAIHPDALEQCNSIDDDCDGKIDEDTDVFDGNGDGTLDCIDDDGDGYLECSNPEDNGALAGCDCDDNNFSRFPGATEVCNAIDDDCNNQRDEGFDQDEDGFTSCGNESGENKDCNDENKQVHPDAEEICNDIDDNCDGIDDLRHSNGVFDQYGAGTFDDPKPDGQLDCIDLDDDGFCGLPPVDSNPESVPTPTPTSGTSALTCYTPPETIPVKPGDCNDGDDAIHPNASEGELSNEGLEPDTNDNNCNGLVDEGTLAYDDDGDRYCEGSTLHPFCTGSILEVLPEALATGDCNDGNDHIYPDNPDEIWWNPDSTQWLGIGISNDCDLTIDEGSVLYDDDGDGYCEGIPDETISCAQRADGFFPRTGDCEDSDANLYPGADEIACDTIDQDCDGSDLLKSPGNDAPEVCNGIDDNCNGFIDEQLGWGWCGCSHVPAAPTTRAPLSSLLTLAGAGLLLRLRRRQHREPLSPLTPPTPALN